MTEAPTSSFISESVPNNWVTMHKAEHSCLLFTALLFPRACEPLSHCEVDGCPVGGDNVLEGIDVIEDAESAAERAPDDLRRRSARVPTWCVGRAGW